MSAYENRSFIFTHNYSLDNTSLTCYVNSSDGNQSITIPLTYQGIEIEEYNSSIIDTDSISIKFKIKNYFTTQDVNWNITTDNLVYKSSSPITLNQGQSTSISQQINFTRGGLKHINIKVRGEHNFTANYTEYYYINWLNIEEFYNTIKNATARVFDFLITNENTLNTTIKWNTTEPLIENITSLNASETLIVVIEENYNQGKKEPTIKVYNQTIYETQLIDIFTIKEIEIEEFKVRKLYFIYSFIFFSMNDIYN